MRISSLPDAWSPVVLSAVYYRLQFHFETCGISKDNLESIGQSEDYFEDKVFTTDCNYRIEFCDQTRKWDDVVKIV